MTNMTDMRNFLKSYNTHAANANNEAVTIAWNYYTNITKENQAKMVRWCNAMFIVKCEENGVWIWFIVEDRRIFIFSFFLQIYTVNTSAGMSKLQVREIKDQYN